ncbi:MAG: DUF2088 domain-containing protein [Candidatus Schekmanbacteria bacterium]|nr:DUF2088 domain-containing protein [Candidatus Schekmanbacteria bacterium]
MTNIAQLPCGTTTVPVELDDHTFLVEQAPNLPLPPQPDLAAAVRNALDHPLDRPPLDTQVGPRSRVTIAFDDPTVPCFAPVWQEGLGQIVEQLLRGGAQEQNLTLLCANALHRKFRREELARTIGQRLVDRFGDRLRCHDAEDPDNLVHVGETSGGFPVELHRAAVDADLCIYLNTSCWKAFNGGWKSICVGLSTYRSIRCHHTPESMSMSLERNRMHEILDEMGALLDERLGTEHFFKVETVLANPFQVGKMWSGSIAATRAEVLKLQAESGQSRRSLLQEKADIVCYGVPAWSPYAAFAGMNPLLTLVSTGLGYLGGVIEALGKPGCSVILATPCPDEWDDAHHPSYREVWNRILPQTKDPEDIRVRFEEELAARPDYVDKYRNGFGFHPAHGIMATYPLKRLRHAARIFVAHAQSPELITHLGFTPVPTVTGALAQARELHGPGATVAVVKYPMAVNRH